MPPPRGLLKGVNMIISDLKNYLIAIEEDKKLHLFDFINYDVALKTFESFIEETLEDSKTTGKTTRIFLVDTKTQAILKDSLIDGGIIYN